MKKIIFTVGLALVTVFSFAQMSKTELKAIKKQIKKQTPEQFVQTKTDLAEATQKVMSLESDLETSSSEKALLESEVKDYKAATQAAKMRIEELEAKRFAYNTAGAGQLPAGEVSNATPSENSSNTASNTPSGSNASTDSYGSYKKGKSVQGLVYKVQIGAYRNYDITKYFNRHDNFSGTVDEDGTMRYTLGSFGDYWEADKFKSYLRSMGVRGAWVVAYKDNRRVSMKDAREGNI